MGTSAIQGNARDVRVLNHVRHLIESDGRIPRFDIDVGIENGAIELLGVIPDKSEHDALLALVQRAAGTRRVVDRLIVAK